MERLRAIESRRVVLLAVSEERAIDFARSFADAGFVPTIAFDREQLARFGQRVELIVADDSIDPDGETLQRTGSPEDTIRVFVTEPHRHAPDDVHALVPTDLRGRRSARAGADVARAAWRPG